MNADWGKICQNLRIPSFGKKALTDLTDETDSADFDPYHPFHPCASVRNRLKKSAGTDLLESVKRQERLKLIGLLLVGAALRLVGLTRMGPAHDEVAHWLIVRRILAGDHALHFSDAYGHEAGYHYIEALIVALVGDNLLGLRLPAALFGLLGIAVSYRLVWALGGNRPIAFWSAALVSVTFFPVFFGRLALRAISYPVLAGLSAWQFRQGWRSGRLRPYLWAGVWGGLSLHTYMAARSLPIFWLLWIGLLWLIRRPRARQQWRQQLLFGLTFAAVAAPLFLWLWLNPGAEERIGEVDAPLRALLAGDFGPVLTNLRLFAGVFGWSGDPLWRQNVAYRPIFDPLTALLFYGGVVVALWQRRLADLFALLWIAVAMLPGLVTTDAPSTIRAIGMLPLIGYFPARLMHSLAQLSTYYPQLSTAKWRKLGTICLTTALILGTARTLLLTWRVWPAEPEVQFVWQTALTEGVRALDKSADSSPVAILGWSPDTMDPPTVALTLRRDDLGLRFFGDALPQPVGVLIVPESADGRFRVLRPRVRDLDPLLERLLTETERTEQFVLSDGRVTPEWPAWAEGEAVLFGGEVWLRGWRVDCTATQCEVMTAWQVENRPNTPLSLFLHLTAPDHPAPLAQSDGLPAPTRFWQPGDWLIKVDRVAIPDPGSPYTLRLGLYDPEIGRRLLTPDGEDHVVLR
jgi:hypothetical protein